MARQRKNKRPEPKASNSQIPVNQAYNPFHVEWTTTQKLAWAAYQKHDLLFLTGVAGSGKSHAATSFAIYDLLTRDSGRSKIVITRPIIESAESIGYLPGTFEEKVAPYMRPIHDCVDRICGGAQKEKVMNNLEVCPLNFMRGRTFNDSIVIFDEAQNATEAQFKLAITRLGINSKMIITGDPDQSDLSPGQSGLSKVAEKIQTVQGVGLIKFKENSIVRHPLIAKILKRL